MASAVVEGKEVEHQEDGETIDVIADVIKEKVTGAAGVEIGPETIEEKGAAADKEIIMEEEAHVVDLSPSEVVQINSDAPVLQIVQIESSPPTENSNVTMTEESSKSAHEKGVTVPDQSADTEKISPTNFVTSYLHKQFEGLTRRQFSILIVLGFVEFFAAACIAIQAPFFPKEAKQKGASAVAYGFVFGVFELTVFFLSPIYGFNMKTWNPMVVFRVGIYVTGVSIFIFGFLNNIVSPDWFIFTCIIVRVIEALGDAAFVTASFTIVALEFPNSVATTFALMESFYGAGAIIGPTLGGAIYDVGGYSVPFILMGVGLFATAAAAQYVLPSIQDSTPDVTQQVQRNKDELFGLQNILKWIKERYGIILIPSIAMIAASVVTVSSGVGFLAATLQPHLEAELNISSGTATGAVFIINGAVYAITAPFWGRLIDRTAEKNLCNPKYFTIAGSVLTILGFLLLGPVPFFPFPTSLWAICIGQFICGLGLGATLVSAFTQTLKDAIAQGYPDDLSTYGQVSGIWTSMLALGFFIGPVSGGILLDSVGFHWGTVFIIVEQLVVIGVISHYLWRINRASKQSTPKTSPPADAETAIGAEAITVVENGAYVHDEGSRSLERKR